MNFALVGGYSSFNMVYIFSFYSGLNWGLSDPEADATVLPSENTENIILTNFWVLKH